MGIWSGIKHALNSTLGTSSFKPLNTMIDEAKSSILSKVEGQRTLVASDSVLKVLWSGATHLGVVDRKPGSFVPDKNGSIRVSVKLYTANRTTGRYLTLSILQGTTVIGSVIIDTVGVDNTTTYHTGSVDVPIVAGTSYEVNLRANVANVYLSTVELCAAIVDTNLVTVTTNQNISS